MVEFSTIRLIYRITINTTIYVAFLLQLLNIAVLIRGIHKRILVDPIYLLWIGYGVADISLILIDYVFYLPVYGFSIPSWYPKKWAAFLENAFGWYPGILYQLALSVYVLVVVRYPVWYFGEKANPELKKKVAGLVVGIMAFSVLLASPLALPGYDTCFCAEGGVSTPQMEVLTPYYRGFQVTVFACTFLSYLYVLVKQNMSGDDVDKDTKKIIRRLTATALGSWAITVFHMFMWQVTFIRFESWKVQIAIRWIMYGSYQLNYLASPVVQLVRNSAYREQMLNMIGLGRMNKVKPSRTSGN